MHPPPPLEDWDEIYLKEIAAPGESQTLESVRQFGGCKPGIWPFCLSFAAP
jgi:hypothetical protein